MLRSAFPRRAATALLSGILICSLILPTSAFFRSKQPKAKVQTELTHNVLIGSTLQFSAQEFSALNADDSLSAITITALPDRSCGVLSIGSQPVDKNTVIRLSALDGLRFQAMNAPTAEQTTFSFVPTFSSGGQGDAVTFHIHLLKEHNQAPIAENMSLSTYKNIPVTGFFQAVDAEGDPLTFQITHSPARGSVTAAEDGTNRFVYTPYENKVGKDSFTYVAVDSAGNLSNPAKVSVRIEKAATTVTYADMGANAAHKAAVRLAEEGLFVGESVNGNYFFSPETPVSRSQFLSMAMSVAGLDPLAQVTMTGFADDTAIPTWAKGYVSSALKAGVISGTRDNEGRIVFSPHAPITRAEATVILNDLLGVSDVSVQTWSALGVTADTKEHWALQAVANLTGAGVLPDGHTTLEMLDAGLTRADVAEMLDCSLDVLEQRKHNSWFGQ